MDGIYAAIADKKTVEQATTRLFEHIHRAFVLNGQNDEAQEPGRKSFSGRLHEKDIPAVLEKTGLALEIKEYLKTLSEYLTGIDTALKPLSGELFADSEEVQNLVVDCLSACLRLKEAAVVLETLFYGTNEKAVKWYEGEKKGRRLSMRLYASPLFIGDILSQTLFKAYDSLVLTSATLSCNGNFDFFLNRTGLGAVSHREVLKVCLPSPFDFRQQANDRHSRPTCRTRTRGYEECQRRALLAVIGCMGGRTLALFTSYRAMDAAAEYLKRNSRTRACGSSSRARTRARTC
jgi:Rad3-related DNA helicase